MKSLDLATLQNQHIILIGFKHVGKTTIGEQLAKKLHKPFIDLDRVIQTLHEENTGIHLSCREIMEQIGQESFRHLEMQALKQVLESKLSSVISLGGGTVCTDINQKLIKAHKIIHISAPRGVVFERILMDGRPAFFNADEDMIKAFNQLWHTREKIYDTLFDISIINNGSVEHSVNTLIEALA